VERLGRFIAAVEERVLAFAFLMEGAAVMMVTFLEETLIA
jgi:hypothetical protein